MAVNHHRIIFVIFLSTIAAFAPFSTDIYLASMPIIQKEMHASIAQVQLTLSLFFIGFALAQLFWGPLSDRIGRKKTILIGVIVYIVGSLLCALSETIYMLIFARLIQAIGACVGIVMALAIIRDCFAETGNMSKMIAITMATAMAAPMIAPVLGSYLLAHFGWQANFYVLFGYGIFLLISTMFFLETYPKNLRKPLPLNKLLQSYRQQLAHKPFLLTALASSTNFCMLFSFISSASFVYINIYDLAPEYFGYFFEQFSFTACIITLALYFQFILKFSVIKSSLIFWALNIIFGVIAPFGGVLVDKIGLRKPALYGLGLFGIGIFSTTLFCYHTPLWLTLGALFTIGSGMGLAFAALNSGVVKTVPADEISIASSVFILFALIGNTFGAVTSTGLYEFFSAMTENHLPGIHAGLYATIIALAFSWWAIYKKMAKNL